MKIFKLTLLATVAVFVGVTGPVPGIVSQEVQAQEVKLKAASFLPGKVIFAKFFYDWVGQTNKQCSGKVKISVVGPAAIGSMKQWEAVKSGVVDMHYGPPTYYKGAAPEAGVSDLATTPFPQQRKNGAYKMLDELHNKKLNSKLIMQVMQGVKFYLYTSKPHKNKRFDGFRLRSAPLYDNFFKSLGASPLRMPAPAVYTALERKTVDGLGWPLWGVSDFSWDKFIKYRHGPGYFSAILNTLMNKKKWDSLSAAQRNCIHGSATSFEVAWPSKVQAQDEKEAARQKKNGVKYVDMGSDFSATATRYYWEEMTSYNPSWIGKIKPLVTQ